MSFNTYFDTKCPECGSFTSAPISLDIILPHETQIRIYKCYCCGFIKYKDGSTKHGKKFQEETKKQTPDS